MLGSMRAQWAWIIYLSRAVMAIQNPVISGFNPDPAILRLGDEYYIATSSFEFYPGFPIYRSSNLQDWELFSHALTKPSQIQLYGTPTSAGVWAPSLSYINGRIYLVCTTRWTYDPVAKVWPRTAWLSSTDMKEWSDLTWADPWGIDPQLFQDPQTNKTYLNIMAPNNNQDRLWGISQCEVDLTSGRCIGAYRSLWNGTMPHDKSARPEGPKMFYRQPYYYLLIAEGGTDDLHRASIARSSSPEGPWLPAPNNPLIYNGAYGFNNLTVQSTGHADFVETSNGEWYASFLARRQINGSASSPLGRETFLTTVHWEDDWPILNNGKPIMLNEGDGVQDIRSTSQPLPTFVDLFNGSSLHPEWYRLRTPYSETFKLETASFPKSRGLTLRPNVFSLSDRDQPAALFRKQKSLNMTFTAYLRDIEAGLQYRQSVGISAYLSELQHQDLGVRQCANETGLCVYSTLMRNGTLQDTEISLNSTTACNLALEIRATPTTYCFSFITNAQPSNGDKQKHFVTSIESSWLAFAPQGWFVFTGASFALFASGNGEPWPYDSSEVGFTKVEETYELDYHENYQRGQT